MRACVRAYSNFELRIFKIEFLLNSDDEDNVSLSLAFENRSSSADDHFPNLNKNVFASLMPKRRQSDSKAKAKTRQLWKLPIIHTVSREN